MKTRAFTSVKTRAALFVTSAITAFAMLTIPVAPASAASLSGHVVTANGVTGSQGIIATMSATGGVGLAFHDNSWTADYASPPSDIPNGGTTSFSVSQKYWSNDMESGAYGTAKAQLYMNGKPTAYWATMYASVYWYPYDKGTCTIYKGDPAYEGAEVGFSPFTCTTSSVNGSDPWKITFSIAPTPAIDVTDPESQKRLLTNACNADDGAQNCVYTPTSVEAFADDAKPFGESVINPGPGVVKQTVEAERKYSESNSIGIAYNSKLTVWEVWSQSLTINYKFTWTDTRTFKQSEEVEVEPHTESWFTISAAMSKITGDFLVRVDGKIYSMRNATVVMPDASKKAAIMWHTRPYTSSVAGASRAM